MKQFEGTHFAFLEKCDSTQRIRMINSMISYNIKNIFPKPPSIDFSSQFSQQIIELFEEIDKINKRDLVSAAHEFYTTFSSVHILTLLLSSPLSEFEKFINDFPISFPSKFICDCHYSIKTNVTNSMICNIITKNGPGPYYSNISIEEIVSLFNRIEASKILTSPELITENHFFDPNSYERAIQIMQRTNIRLGTLLIPSYFERITEPVPNFDFMSQTNQDYRELGSLCNSIINLSLNTPFSMLNYLRNPIKVGDLSKSISPSNPPTTATTLINFGLAQIKPCMSCNCFQGIRHNMLFSADFKNYIITTADPMVCPYQHEEEMPIEHSDYLRLKYGDHIDLSNGDGIDYLRSFDNMGPIEIHILRLLTIVATISEHREQTNYFQMKIVINSISEMLFPYTSISASEKTSLFFASAILDHFRQILYALKDEPEITSISQFRHAFSSIIEPYVSSVWENLPTLMGFPDSKPIIYPFGLRYLLVPFLVDFNLRKTMPVIYSFLRLAQKFKRISLLPKIVPTLMKILNEMDDRYDDEIEDAYPGFVAEFAKASAFIQNDLIDEGTRTKLSAMTDQDTALFSDFAPSNHDSWAVLEVLTAISNGHNEFVNVLEENTNCQIDSIYDTELEAFYNSVRINVGELSGLLLDICSGDLGSNGIVWNQNHEREFIKRLSKMHFFKILHTPLNSGGKVIRKQKTLYSLTKHIPMNLTNYQKNCIIRNVSPDLAQEIKKGSKLAIEWLSKIGIDESQFGNVLKIMHLSRNGVDPIGDAFMMRFKNEGNEFQHVFVKQWNDNNWAGLVCLLRRTMVYILGQSKNFRENSKLKSILGKINHQIIAKQNKLFHRTDTAMFDISKIENLGLSILKKEEILDINISQIYSLYQIALQHYIM